jgi:hypothetical protein
MYCARVGIGTRTPTVARLHRNNPTVGRRRASGAAALDELRAVSHDRYRAPPISMSATVGWLVDWLASWRRHSRGRSIRYPRCLLLYSCVTREVGGATGTLTRGLVYQQRSVVSSNELSPRIEQYATSLAVSAALW